MDNQKNLIRFFPFALTRIERLRDYLNRMYESGYQIVKINFGCILIFQKAAAKEDFKYFILTRHFYSKARVKKWDDVDLLENISPQFHKGNGEQFHVYVWLSSAMYLSNPSYPRSGLRKNNCIQKKASFQSECNEDRLLVASDCTAYI